FSSRRRHTRWPRDWSSDVCSSDLVEAVKAGGATDYIRKSPGLVDEIKLAINRALEKMNLSRQNFAFKRDAATRNSLDNIVGVSRSEERRVGKECRAWGEGEQ